MRDLPIRVIATQCPLLQTFQISERLRGKNNRRRGRSGCGSRSFDWTSTLRKTARRDQHKADRKEAAPVIHPTKMSSSARMTSALHIHSRCLERTFVLCQKRKQSNGFVKTSERESLPQPKQANLSGKRWSIFARENMALPQRNKRSRSVCPNPTRRRETSAAETRFAQDEETSAT